MAKTYWVYLMASHSRCLCVGCSSNLPRRVIQHRIGFYRGHTSRYRISRLVWYEQAPHAWPMVRRERQLKGWLRARKIALIEERNPAWRDLSCELGLPPHRPGERPARSDEDPSLRSG
jgi:putative endonuclease